MNLSGDLKCPDRNTMWSPECYIGIQDPLQSPGSSTSPSGIVFKFHGMNLPLTVAQKVRNTVVETYWKIGKRIVEKVNYFGVLEDPFKTKGSVLSKNILVW